MKEYFQRVLHQEIEEYPYDGTESMPLVCRNSFELSVIRMGNQEFLLASPIEDMNLTELRKMRICLERYTGYRCVFYLKKLNWYAAPRMVEEGIPFIWENRQIYLPFIGMVLENDSYRTPKYCAVISFLTQKLLLKALYENWQDVPATRAAEWLGVSRMSVTRCYDEIESLGMPFLKRQRKSRRFYATADKKEMWNTMLPFLRNPIIRTFRLEGRPEAEMILGGISALSEYSMLGEDSGVTYVVQKSQVRELKLDEIRSVPPNEEPMCIIHEVGYILPFGEGSAVDPLTLTLMLKEESHADPRVEICLDEMLEELVW